MECFALTWISLALLGSWVASQKQRSGAEGCLLGILFGPFGVLIEALLPTPPTPREPTARELVEGERMRAAGQERRLQAVIMIGLGLAGLAAVLAVGFALPWLFRSVASAVGSIPITAVSTWLVRLLIVILILVPFGLFAGYLATTKGRRFDRGFLLGCLLGPLGLLIVVFWEAPVEAEPTAKPSPRGEKKPGRPRAAPGEVFEDIDLDWLDRP